GEKRQVQLKTTPRRAGLLVLTEDSAGNAIEAQVAIDGASLGAGYESHTVPLCSRTLRVDSPGLGAWTLDLSGPRLAERQTATVTATLGRSRATGRASNLTLPKGVRAGPRGDGAKAWRGTSEAQLQLVSFMSSPEGGQVSVDGQPVCALPPPAAPSAVATRTLRPGSGHQTTPETAPAHRYRAQVAASQQLGDPRPAQPVGPRQTGAALVPSPEGSLSRRRQRWGRTRRCRAGAVPRRAPRIV
ncbi:MAG: hypothetical protein QF464_12835, partial [Myxococcota bacterium]|nr:hypothetical protein [Myxococcota bacterium]